MVLAAALLYVHPNHPSLCRVFHARSIRFVLSRFYSRFYFFFELLFASAVRKLSISLLPEENLHSVGLFLGFEIVSTSQMTIQFRVFRTSYDTPLWRENLFRICSLGIWSDSRIGFRIFLRLPHTHPVISWAPGSTNLNSSGYVVGLVPSCLWHVSVRLLSPVFFRFVISFFLVHSCLTVFLTWCFPRAVSLIIDGYGSFAIGSRCLFLFVFNL